MRDGFFGRGAVFSVLELVKELLEGELRGEDGHPG